MAQYKNNELRKLEELGDDLQPVLSKLLQKVV